MGLTRRSGTEIYRTVVEVVALGACAVLRPEPEFLPSARRDATPAAPVAPAAVGPPVRRYSGSTIYRAAVVTVTFAAGSVLVPTPAVAHPEPPIPPAAAEAVCAALATANAYAPAVPGCDASGGVPFLSGLPVPQVPQVQFVLPNTPKMPPLPVTPQPSSGSSDPGGSAGSGGAGAGGGSGSVGHSGGGGGSTGGGSGRPGPDLGDLDPDGDGSWLPPGDTGDTGFPGARPILSETIDITKMLGSALVFGGGFETGDLSQFSNCQWRGYNGSCDEWSGSEPVGVFNQGPGHESAARYVVRPGDVAPGAGGNRAETRAPDAADVRAGDQRWYQFSVLVPQGFRNPDGGWFILMQWHAGDGSPPLALQINRNGELELSNNRTGRATTIGTVTPGRWMDIALFVQFGSSGSATAYVNGTKAPQAHTAPNMASGSNYLKMGIYRDSDTSGTHEVWLDNLLISRP